MILDEFLSYCGMVFLGVTAAFGLAHVLADHGDDIGALVVAVLQ